MKKKAKKKKTNRANVVLRNDREEVALSVAVAYRFMSNAARRMARVREKECRMCGICEECQTERDLKDTLFRIGQLNAIVKSIVTDGAINPRRRDGRGR